MYFDFTTPKAVEKRERKRKDWMEKRLAFL